MLKRLLAPLSRQTDPVRAASAIMPQRARMVRARFDSAQTTADNRRHWAAADGLSPNAAVSPEVRRILRNRARYEVANNSYAKGIVLTLANDTIGTGPRLQMLTPDASVNARVEEAFEAWSAAIDLPGKLRSMRMARAESGEAFGLLISSPGLDTPVKLDLRLLEPDQVATPAWSMERGAFSSKLPADRSQLIDGIAFDASGLPVAYHVLRHHPGDGAWHAVRDHDTFPAASVLHYFRPDRPGQWRGIPDITPALPLFAQLRRYTLAVIAAAETAADFAAVLYTDAPANGEADPLEPMDEVELEKRMATVLPGGWKLGQVHAEHPSTTYGEFKREILNEIARCLNMPFNVAAGNSSGYNYASGRLDHQTYFKSIRVEQHRLQQTVLDRLLRAWLDEAALVEGLLPQAMRVRGAATPHVWFWDGVEHVDPAKEANAQATRLANHTTTLAHEFARQGRDWEDELRQRAKYLELAARPGSAYGSTNHGRHAVPIVRAWKPRFVVDFGCGRNNFIRHLRRLGIDGLGVDFAFEDADVVKPMHATELVEGVADVVTCFDALEHLLPEDVNPVLAEMRRVARPRGWFCVSVCTRPSRITALGENLHPTVRPSNWWLDRIGRVGTVTDCRAGGRYIIGRFTR